MIPNLAKILKKLWLNYKVGLADSLSADRQAIRHLKTIANRNSRHPVQNIGSGGFRSAIKRITVWKPLYPGLAYFGFGEL